MNVLLKKSLLAVAALAPFAMPGSAFGQWTKVGTSIYPTTITDNVGIGTTTPGRRLEVSSSGVPQLRLNESGTYWDIFAGGNFLIQKGSSPAVEWLKFDDVAHSVQMGPADEFFIDLTLGNVGNTGIGTTAPVSKLTVNGTITPGADCSQNIGSASRRWSTFYACNGMINTSDARQKENITDIKYGLADVMKLHPVSFTWKESPEYGPKLGLIAQEVAAVVSEVVKTGDDPNHTMGIFYSDLIPVLVKAIQDQQGEIHDQQKMITRQAERISRLEAALNLGTLSVDNDKDMSVASKVTVSQNDPNPSAETTSIAYYIPESVTKAELLISEMGSGREVARIAVSERGNGVVSVPVKGYASGTYIYAMVVDGKLSAGRKMIVAR